MSITRKNHCSNIVESGCLDGIVFYPPSSVFWIRDKTFQLRRTGLKDQTQPCQNMHTLLYSIFLNYFYAEIIQYVVTVRYYNYVAIRARKSKICLWKPFRKLLKITKWVWQSGRKQTVSCLKLLHSAVHNFILSFLKFMKQKLHIQVQTFEYILVVEEQHLNLNPPALDFRWM